jgi:hypothetical protein
MQTLAIDSEWEVVSYPKKELPYVKIYNNAKKCWKMLYKTYTIGYGFSRVISRLIWINFTLAPWCSPKIALCTSLVVLIMFMKNLRQATHN